MAPYVSSSHQDFNFKYILVKLNFFFKNHLTNLNFIFKELAKNFLHCMNNWDFESPKDRKEQVSSEDASTYKINYTRSPFDLI
jgi:hypothetical protein